MTVVPRTIQLDDATYEALRSFKIGGMTFADVIRRLMERQDPEAFHAEYRAWQERVLERIRSSDEARPL